MTAIEPNDPVLFAILNEIGIIEQLARNHFERVMPDGMTVAQFSMLNHFVRLGGPRSPAELARSFQVTKGAITSLVGKLAEKGYLTVANDPEDGRAKRVDVTDAGRSARDACVAALAPELEVMTRALGRDGWGETLAQLRKMRTYLDEARAPKR